MREILFPTLICAVYNNQRNLEIVLQDYSKNYLLTFLSNNRASLKKCEESKEEEKKNPRSLSFSSTTSSQSNLTTTPQMCFILINRFPPDEWDNVIEFINNCN